MTDYFSQIELAKNEALAFFGDRSYLRKPLDLMRILEDKGIRYYEEAMEDGVSGFLKINTKDGNPVIVVNSNHSMTRKRFSIAHEIAHYVLHGKLEQLYVNRHAEPYVFKRDQNSSTGEDMLEIQANQFAAELLMPTFDVERRLRNYIAHDEKLPDIIENLADFYQVSIAAMTIKVGKLISDYQIT